MSKILRPKEAQGPEVLLVHDQVPAALAKNAGTSRVATEKVLIEEARRNAAAIVKAARNEARGILEKARHEASQITFQAYQDGFNQGSQEGRNLALQEMNSALETVRGVALEAKQIRDKIIQNSERQIIELVIDVVRRVLTEEVAKDPSLVIDTVDKAIKRAGAQNIVRIRVNPADVDVVSVSFSERSPGIPGEGWEVAGDDQIALGGCIIDTTTGTVDARLDAQVEQIAESFREMTYGKES